MEPTKSIIKNEDGVVMILAVIILLMVSIIGIESSNVSSVEVQIAGSEQTAKRNFYAAEGAAVEAAQRIENADDDTLKDKSEDWLNSDDIDLSDEDNWDYDESENNDTANQATVDSNAVYAVVDSGVAQGSSLIMSNQSRLHDFKAYGRYVAPSQGAFIEMGYRKRF